MRTDGHPDGDTWNGLRIAVRRTRRTDAKSTIPGAVLEQIDLIDEHWTAWTRDTARLDAMRAEGSRHSIRTAGEGAIYRAIARTEPQPRVPMHNVERAAELGVTLREPPPRLRPWRARDDELASPRRGEASVPDDAVIVAGSFERTTAYTVEAAATMGGIAERLFAADDRYAGAGWYDALPRMVDAAVEITEDDATWRPGEDPKGVQASSRKVGAIDVVLSGSLPPVEDKEQPTSLRLPAEVAFGRTREQVAAGEDPVIYATETIRAEPEEIEDLIARALGGEDPPGWMRRSARFISMKLRHGHAHAVRDAIEHALATGVAPWLGELPDAEGRTVRISMRNGALAGLEVVDGDEIAPAQRIADSAHVHPSARLGTNVVVGEDATIERGAAIGDGCVIGTGVRISENVRVEGVASIGDRSAIEAGTVIAVEKGELAHRIECRNAEGTEHDVSDGTIPAGMQVRHAKASADAVRDLLIIRGDAAGLRVEPPKGRKKRITLHLDHENVIVDTDENVHVVFRQRARREHLPPGPGRRQRPARRLGRRRREPRGRGRRPRLPQRQRARQRGARGHRLGQRGARGRRPRQRDAQRARSRQRVAARRGRRRRPAGRIRDGRRAARRRRRRRRRAHGDRRTRRPHGPGPRDQPRTRGVGGPDGSDRRPTGMQMDTDETSAINAGTAATGLVRGRGDDTEPTCVRHGNGLLTVWPAGRPTTPEGTVASVTFRATRTGWHGVRTVRGEEPGTTAVVIMWLHDRLAAPEKSAGESRHWLDAADDGQQAADVHAARELARFFILGHAGQFDTDIGRELHERKDEDPYPELSQLGLDNEQLLGQLAHEPETLDGDGWADVRDIGRRVRGLIGQAPDEGEEAAGGSDRSAAATGVHRVYTDGSAVPNPGAGGWAVVWTRDGEVVREAGGSAAETTNNRMELQALIEALRMLPDDAGATIFSDSELAVRTINEWAPGWRDRGWRRKRGPIANLDLVQALLALAEAHPRCRIEWTRGHAGNAWNERADRLANQARIRGARS